MILTKLRRLNLVLAFMAVGLCLFLIFSSCSKKAETSIKVRLLWLNQAQFAGIYSAKEEGFFKQSGLDVSIIPGGPGINPVRMVASGSAEQIGVCSGIDIIMAREKGIPVRALAVVVRKNPTSFFAKSNSGISTVKDFVGKKIGVKIGFELEYYLTAMLKNGGVDEASIERVPIQFDLTPFFSGDIDVWCGYRINEPNIVRAKNIEVVEILPSDYGVNVVGDVIFTSESFYKDNPDICRRFVDNVWKGWQFAKANREKAIKHTMKYNPKGDSTHEAAMLNSIIPLIFVKDRISLFDQNFEIWQTMIDFLKEYNVIEKRINPSDCFWKIK